MKQLILASVAAVGILLVATSSSEAGGVHYGYGGTHHGVHGHHNHGFGGYAPSYGCYYPSYPQWHDTSHYDWHPGGFVPHGNHYHYVPGHYDLHRTGHWDY